MADLTVRNVDESIVKALRQRAIRQGTSENVEHRKILVQALLLQPERKSFVEALNLIPNVGRDSDFERTQDRVVESVFE